MQDQKKHMQSNNSDYKKLDSYRIWIRQQHVTPLAVIWSRAMRNYTLPEHLVLPKVLHFLLRFNCCQMH